VEQALLHYFDKTTGRKSRKPPQFAKKSQRIVALIETSAPICLERFSDYPQLGRFTLRDEGTRGVVLTVSPPADPTW
jgi:peptide chain release factor subunit 3